MAELTSALILCFACSRRGLDTERYLHQFDLASVRVIKLSRVDIINLFLLDLH